jgi:MADS-box transcription factor, plant
MGRKKIPIRARRGRAQQQLTYNKRKDGLATKARELAILCDIEVLLLTFSPKDQPLLVLGPTTEFEQIINKYIASGPSERERSRNENVKALCNAFKSDKYMKEDDLHQLLDLPRPDALTEELTQDISEELGPLS